MDAFVERYSAFSVVSVADPILLLGFLCLFCGCCLSVVVFVFFCFRRIDECFVKWCR